MSCLNNTCGHVTPLDREIARLSPRQRFVAGVYLRDIREGAWGVHTLYNRESVMLNLLRYIDLCMGASDPAPGRDMRS